jgi:hypothetical protein
MIRQTKVRTLISPMTLPQRVDRAYMGHYRLAGSRVSLGGLVEDEPATASIIS